MSVIGQLEEIKQSGRSEFVGYVRTLQLALRFRLAENQSGNSPEAPHYLIVAKSIDGREIQIGAAWKRRAKAQATEGDEFLSITFDDPSLEKPLNVAAFRKADGFWDITWRRRQVQSSDARP